MEIKLTTKQDLERAIFYLLDNPDKEVLFYHHHEYIAIISVAISICNAFRIPYKLYTNEIKINGGILKFVRT